MTLVLGAAVVLLSLATMACLRGFRMPSPNPVSTTMAEVSQRVGDVNIHVLRTGWVSVKEAHRTLSTVDGLRTIAILGDQRWTEWMPVTVYAIDHPEGVFLVDAGLSEATLDPNHFTCDPVTEFIYSNLLRFKFSPEDRIDRKLAALGIPLSRVRGVVFTHRHADHTDGVDHLPDSTIAYVGAGDWPTHNGALPCRWPGGRTPVLVADEGPSFGEFPHSTALTADGALRVVPLRGHSPGHLGVLLQANQQFFLFAGDATFHLSQVEDGIIAGISEVPDLARQSLTLIATQLRKHPTFLLPAHDPDSVTRFERGEVSVLRSR